MRSRASRAGLAGRRSNRAGWRRRPSRRNLSVRRVPSVGTKTKLTIHEEKTVKVAAPPGSRFKGYTSFVVQDLILRPHVVDFRCERWLTPDGTLLTAPLPDGIEGHFGPDLRRFI